MIEWLRLYKYPTIPIKVHIKLSGLELNRYFYQKLYLPLII